VAQHDALPSHVVLGHGDPEMQWVLVGVMRRQPDIDIVGTLAGMHGAADELHLTLEETHAKEWTDVEIVVEGSPKRFSTIGDARHWLAYREQVETWLFVHALGIPPAAIALAQVDPHDYLTGG
jgi:hypothetical protein